MWEAVADVSGHSPVGSPTGAGEHLGGQEEGPGSAQGLGRCHKEVMKDRRHRVSVGNVLFPSDVQETSRLTSISKYHSVGK